MNNLTRETARGLASQSAPHAAHAPQATHASAAASERHCASHGLWQRTAPGARELGELTENLLADVLVIGAGYTGLSTALHLRERHVSVVVLEATDIGFGGSGRNVGLVNAGMWVMPEVVVERLGPDYGNRLLQSLADAPGVVFGLIEKYAIACEALRSGTLHCAVGRKGLVEVRERARQWQARSAPVTLLNARETRMRVGSDAYCAALFDARAGTIQPLAYARGLAEAARAGGARIYIRSPAVAARTSERGWIVDSPAGSVRAEWIVVATDAYATGPWDIVRREQVHLPYFNFATPPLAESVRKSILPGGEGAWDTRQVLSSFRLDAAGRLVFGSVGALRGPGTRVHEQWARRAARRIFPQLGNTAFEAGWFGHIGMTADNLPRFHVFAPRVVGFNGYNGRGIAPGTAFGRILAELVVGERREQDLPLPVSAPRGIAWRSLREAAYEYGAGALHLAGARF
ncbi:MAG TPA: FAD-binding oxidoreductase [Steroidobacteraceae bacterium]